MFSIPDMGNRYYMMPMLSGWSEVIKVAASTTTGSKAQTYAITGPGWSGTLPRGHDAGEVADRHGVDPRPHLQHRHARGLRGRARAAGQVQRRAAVGLGQALHADAGRGRCRRST